MNGKTEIKYTKQANKDAKKLYSAGLKSKAIAIIEILKTNPFQTPPSYEKLSGDLKGLYSRRINIQHRFVYQIYKEIKTGKVISLWTHYG